MIREFTEAAVAMVTQLETTNTSKLARRIAVKLGSLSDDLHIDACIVDAELQEVREVLDGLLGEAETEGDDQSGLCQRARNLMEKLRH